MANLQIKDGTGAAVYIKSNGAASSGDPAITIHAIDQTTDGTTNAVHLVAGTAMAGAFVHPVVVVSTTPTLDTSAYASGDLICDNTTITSLLRVNAGYVKITDVIISDQDDQGVAFNIFVLTDNSTFGTFNAAPSISDANSLKIQAIIPVATTDYVDLGGTRVAHVRNINAVVGGAAAANMFYAIVNGTGTPTFSASGMRVVFKAEQY